MDNIRTQIYLRKDQHHLLRDEAHRLGVPLTELLRRALDAYFTQPALRNKPNKGLSTLVGIAQAGPADGSVRHDDYSATAIDEDLARERQPPKAQ